MGTLGVIEKEVVTNTGPGISAILICFQIHFLVLYRPPQTFYEEIVAIPPFFIHADPDSVSLKETGEGLTGELGSLEHSQYLGVSLSIPANCG